MGVSNTDYKYINNTGKLPGMEEPSLYNGMYDVWKMMNNNNSEGLDKYLQWLGYKGNPVTAAPTQKIQPDFRQPDLQVDVPIVRSEAYKKYARLNDLKSIGGKILPAVPSAIGFIGDLVNSGNYDGSVEDMNNIAGRSQASVMGRSYDEQNLIGNQESSRIAKQAFPNALKTAASGAMTGTAFAGPVGGVIGGVIGVVGGLYRSLKAKAKARRLERLQRQNANRQNEFNRLKTYSDALRDLEMQEDNV